MANEIGPFPAGTKPLRTGVYRTHIPHVRPTNVKTFQWFNVATGMWSVYMPTARNARLCAGRISRHQAPRWWGLDQEVV